MIRLITWRQSYLRLMCCSHKLFDGQLLNLFATGRSGTIGQFLSDEVSPLSFREFLSSRNLSAVKGKEIDLIHLGGVVGPALVAENPAHAHFANVGILEEFIGSLGKVASICHLTFVSTSHVYGEVSLGELLTENSKLSPTTDYARQKLQAEEELARLCSANGVTLTILRLFSILGVTGKPFTLAGRIQEAANGQTVSIKNSEDMRDFLTPAGAAEAIERVAKLRISGTFNLCTGRALSVKEAATRVLVAHQVPLEKVVFEEGKSDNPWIVGNPEKLNNASGLSFEFSPGVMS